MAIAKYPELAFEGHMEAAGQLRGQRRDLVGERQDFQAATIADPDSPEAHFMLGYTQETLGDPANAKIFQKALDLKPGYPDAQRGCCACPNPVNCGRTQATALIR